MLGGFWGAGGGRREMLHPVCLLFLSALFQKGSFTLLATVSSGLQLPSASWNQSPGAPQRCPPQPVLRSLSASPMGTLTESLSSQILRGQHLPFRGLVPALWVSFSKLLDSDNLTPPLAVRVVGASYNYSVSLNFFQFSNTY